MTDDAITSNDDLPPCPPILLGIRAALGQSLLEEILSSKILLIGSGGIGCELLKNLALSGFRHVEVVDLDTIDVSNLNRQFLFRSVHVGMPKCVVASEAALRMVPPPPPPPSPPPTPTTRSSQAAAYLPHHGNVFDNSRFNVPFFQKFALVLNALDNVAARRRVNRLCLASDVPLIEAGTAGYLGQVTVIDRRSGTECYECQPKPTQKVYPICTIRSTPSQPVHCVVWAKELYRLCFGPKVEDSMLYEDEEGLRERREGDDDGDGDGDGDEKKDDDGRRTTTTGDEGSADVAAGGAKGGGGSSAYMGAMTDLRSLLGVDPASSPGSSSSSSSSTSPTPYDVASAVRSKAREVISALFVTEIEKQIGMGTYRTADRAPEPLSSSDVDSCRDVVPSPTMRDGCAPTDVWSVRECVAEIASCLVEVAENAIAQDPTFPLPEFDKDDDVAMRFVTAASNLRSYVFGIEPIQSMYDAKGMAGNIIPAIATTNAIVAGLQVLQVFHVLRAQLDVKKNGGEGGKLKECCRYIYCLRDKTRKGYLLQPTTLPDPNPECFVCRNAIVSLALNTNEWTLDMLLKRVVKKELGFAEPTVMIGEDIVYEEGEDIDPSEYAANLAKKMVDLPGGGAGHGSVLRIEDFTQDLEVEVSVSHRDCWVDVDEEKGGEAKDDGRAEMEKFEIGGKKLVAATAASSDSMKGDSVSAESDGFRAASANEGEDVLLVEENYVPRGVNEDSKMPAQTSSEHGNGSKEQLKKRAFADQAENGAKKAKFNVEDAKKPDLSEVMS
ncbi:hypothetical protein ACHAW5_001348 [Stephanodiscus triporus]|uniref:SUMO-activating enzyme subunit n=1 Tax=Stephanodiscus triporus TaxID=2934178 RepID=A0ABD3NZB4_9STRA